MSSVAVVTPPHVAGPLRLEPFRALRLTSSRIGDPASARAFARPYRDVARRLATWERRGFMSHDAQPALYLHEYASSGIVVRGLVGALDVSRRALHPQDRAVLPHEGIYPAQADDLADRMEQMAINPAPIVLVQRSPSALRDELRLVRGTAPQQQFVDRNGNAHRIWPIHEPERLSRIAALLAPTRAVIADGHHRYAAYLRLQQRHPKSPADLGLAMVIDQDDTPLFLGAIHRVLTGTSVDDVAAAAAALGVVHHALAPQEALTALAPHTIVATDSEHAVVLRPRLDPGQAVVELLHDQLVPALGHGPNRITFHHTVTEAVDRSSPDVGTAILLPAPTLEQVETIALANRLFPEKATSFQPKPPMGVLIRTLHDGPFAQSSPPPPPSRPRPRAS